MEGTLVLFMGLSLLGGIGLTIGAANERNSSLGAAAGGLFVCLGLCLYSLTKLEIAKRRDARENQNHNPKE